MPSRTSGDSSRFCIGELLHHTPSFSSFFSHLGVTHIVLPIDLPWRQSLEMATQSRRWVYLHLRSSPQAHSKQFNGKWVSYTHTAMAYGMYWTKYVVEYTDTLKLPLSAHSLLDCKITPRLLTWTSTEHTQVAALPQDCTK